MKKLSLILPFLLVFLYGCDKIDHSLKKNPYGPLIPTLDSSAVHKVQQRILVEDFTAASCKNCYLGDDKIANLSLKYPGRIIGVAIHCTADAIPNTDHPQDYRSQTSTDLYKFFSPYATPFGMINRLDYPEKALIQIDQWQKRIDNEIDTTLKMEVYIDSVQSLSGYEIKAYVRIKAFKNISSKNLYICGQILENHLIGAQSIEQIVKPNYEHNHVLRTSFNGTFGEEFSTNGMQTGEVFSKNFTATLDPSWVKKNLSVVFYVYDRGDYHVIQVNKYDLK